MSNDDRPDLSWWTEGAVDDAVREDLTRQLEWIDANYRPKEQRELKLQRVIACLNCRSAVIKIAELKLSDGTPIQAIRIRPPEDFEVESDVPRDDPKAMARAMQKLKRSFRRGSWSTPGLFIKGQPVNGSFSVACKCSEYMLTAAKVLTGEITAVGKHRKPDVDSDGEN